MNLNTLFLLQVPATEPAKQGFGGGGSQMIIFIVLIIVVFYFFMIRPQQKKQKQMQNFRDALKKGDNIVTIGGIHGKIVSIEETTFTIEVEDGGKLKIDKAAVAIDANELNKKK
jgi:preprotein translocase subunit YajC